MFRVQTWLVVAAISWTALWAGPAAATCAGNCIDEAPVWVWATVECDGDWYTEGCRCSCATSSADLVSGMDCTQVGEVTSTWSGTGDTGDTGDTGSPADTGASPADPICEFVTMECLGTTCGGGGYDYDNGGASGKVGGPGCACTSGPASGGAAGVLAVLLLLGLRRSHR